MSIVNDKNIVKEMETSFLDYSMSVIVSRALPDVRDGLKPVHRRIVHVMQESNYGPTAPYKKSARVVGDVMGKYHPHGDSSIYDAMVRMAQDFSYRYPLVDGHGNFGSMDGDGAAAQRYTEARMSKLTLELVRDIKKGTVDFVTNYDGELKEPSVLPAKFPNLLVNGSMGIAVGMATNIPPHNLTEVINGIVAYINNKDIDTTGLMEYIKGPDFPTAGIILGNSGIKKAYETGKGSMQVRARCEINEKPNGKSQIIVTEVPYFTNKAAMITKIAHLVRDKVIDGITDIRDESSSRTGIRIVIELRRDVNSKVVLNNLYKYSGLQTSFSANLLALVNGVPKVLTLKDMIVHYVDHQKDVLVRKSKFELVKSEERVHILEGFKIALDNMDEIIKIIRNAESDQEAKIKLIERFKLSDAQAEAILEMKLRRLTGLEKSKILAELEELLKLIAYLKELIDSDEMQLGVIKEDLIEIKNKYGDERRTHIDLTAIEYIEDESLIPVKEIIVTLTDKGYIKQLPVETYKIQNRGGVGIKGMATNEEDYVNKMLYAKTHDHILFFSNKGKVYRIKGYEIPEFSRTSKGLPIVNLLPFDEGEYVNSMLKIENEDEAKYLVFVTKEGLVKRTNLSEFDSIRNNGKIAISLKEDDELIAVKKTDGNKIIAIASNDGRMVSFEENGIRVMGRSAAGVKGINLGDSVCIGGEVLSDTDQILIVTENGYGKRTDASEYRLTNRGGKGVKTLNMTDKTGRIISFKIVDGSEDMLMVTDAGIMIRLDVSKISKLSRVTQGVRLMNLKDEQKVVAVAITPKMSDEDENENNEIDIEVVTIEDEVVSEESVIVENNED